RNVLGIEVVGGGSQVSRVAPRVDVLKAHECSVPLVRPGRERIEQQVGEDEYAVALARVAERQLADVRQVPGANSPRKLRDVRADRPRQDAYASAVQPCVAHDSLLPARPTRERSALVANFGDGRVIEDG